MERSPGCKPIRSDGSVAHYSGVNLPVPKWVNRARALLRMLGPLSDPRSDPLSDP